jgi:DNA primase
VTKALDVPSLLDALNVNVQRHVGEVYWAPCPLPDHPEHTPSWFMRERPGDRFHGAWHCYGCKASGWPVQLVQLMLGLKTQKEAAVWLKTMPEIESPIPMRIEVVPVPRVQALRVPREVEFEEWPARFADYLAGRGVTESQRDGWGLGYVPKDSESELADRVWLPAHDMGGRLLSYTARAIKPVRRRYREPFRSEGASDAAIFGEVRWPSVSKDVAIVAEGAFNVLALERVLPRPVALAALMGSSLDSLQVLKLSGFKRLLLATDPDKAGEKAAAALRAALARYCQIEQLPIPRGQDCDSMNPGDLEGLLASRL